MATLIINKKIAFCKEIEACLVMCQMVKDLIIGVAKKKERSFSRKTRLFSAKR